MTNNSVLQKIQFALHLTPEELARIFKHVAFPMDAKQLLGYFIDTKHEDFVACPHNALAAFLEGLIIERRGINEKNPAPTEFANTPLDNSDIFKKLRIALDLHTEDIEVILEKANVDIKKNDLSSIFRKKGHKNYKVCSDAILESFLARVRIKKG